MEPIRYCYRFTLPNGEVKEFRFQLDGETLALIHPGPSAAAPDWTKLSFSQCPNCPLKESDHPQCPIAANLTDIVEFFKDSVSSDTVDLQIENNDRTFSKRTSMANGISALLGIVMVTSGCPVMDRLRPMARLHLPFSTVEETMFRTLTMYLMAQYFIHKKGGKADWDMEHLAAIFEDIRTVNRSFCQRLYGTCMKDGSVNAVIHLDSFVELTNFALLKKKDRLVKLERIFEAYFSKPAPKA